MSIDYTCDRCGTRMRYPHVTLDINRFAPSMGDFTGERHLCPPCDQDFVDWMSPASADDG